MTHEIASVICGGEGPDLDANCGKLTLFDNTENAFTPCEAYQLILEGSSSDVIFYLHDDVALYDTEVVPKVLALFENPACVCVGLGGATELGREGLYKRPYRISDMARGNYCSNQTDWQVHGGLLEGAKRVAVNDAFFLAVRSSFLKDIGGWPVKHIGHHGIDLWIACMAARYGKEVWAIGISCHHFGGGTSTKPVYREAKWLQGNSLVSDHERPHRFLYEEFRDILPIRVTR